MFLLCVGHVINFVNFFLFKKTKVAVPFVPLMGVGKKTHEGSKGCPLSVQAVWTLAVCCVPLLFSCVFNFLLQSRFVALSIRLLYLNPFILLLGCSLA